MDVNLDDAEVQTPARSPKWLVVNCPAGETMDYEEALIEAGIGVWTPGLWIRRRVPRRRVRAWRLSPVMPGYLFFPIPDLPAFEALRDRFKQELRPMKIMSRFVVLGDEDLEGLRAFDNRVKPGVTARTPPAGGTGQGHGPAEEDKIPEAEWAVGTGVRLKGVLEGVEGVVRSKLPGGLYSVAIKNSPARVSIQGFLLQPLAIVRGE